MSRDVFPPLGIPTIYVAQPFEYRFLYITGIEHVESKSIQGASIMKLQFHPGSDMSQALAETISYVNRARAFMPPGTVPPFVTRFDAGSVAGWASGLFHQEPESDGRANAGCCAEPRPPAVRVAARRVSAAAVRRERADDRHQREAGPDARLLLLA
jgi:hypothetical protein